MGAVPDSVQPCFMVKYICFLRDSNAAEKIAALNEKDAGLAQKIKQFISNLLKRLRELMSGMKPDSFEGKLVSEMTASIEQLHKLWIDALADAGEAYSGAEGVVNSEGGVKEQARGSNTTKDTSYNAFREMMAKLELDEVSKKLGKQFPLSADFDATMIADITPLQMETVVKNSVTTSKGKGAFVTGKNAFTKKYGTKTDVHIKQLGLDAELYSNIATESISKAIGQSNQQSTLDVIPHLKKILNNSICLAVERVVHTDNKRTSLFGYRLYNFYWYQDGKNKTLHCLVSTVVQNTDNAEGHVFKNIENVTIGRGLPGKNADMSASVNGDTYSISQLYQFVKGLERKDGGIKYSQIEKQTYGFEYDSRNDGELYSDRDPDALTNREILANMLDSVAESDRDKAFLDKYKARLAQIDEDTAEIARLKEEKKGAEKLRREVIANDNERSAPTVLRSELLWFLALLFCKEGGGIYAHSHVCHVHIGFCGHGLTVEEVKADELCSKVSVCVGSEGLDRAVAQKVDDQNMPFAVLDKQVLTQCGSKVRKVAGALGLGFCGTGEELYVAVFNVFLIGGGNTVFHYHIMSGNLISASVDRSVGLSAGTVAPVADEVDSVIGEKLCFDRSGSTCLMECFCIDVQIQKVCIGCLGSARCGVYLSASLLCLYKINSHDILVEADDLVEGLADRDISHVNVGALGHNGIKDVESEILDV